MSFVCTYFNGRTTLTTAKIVKQINIVNKIFLNNSIIENAIYLLVTKRAHFGTFSMVVDIPSTFGAPCPTSTSAQFVKLRCWHMLKLCEKQQTTLCLLRRLVQTTMIATMTLRQSQKQMTSRKMTVNSLINKLSLWRRPPLL